MLSLGLSIGRYKCITSAGADPGVGVRGDEIRQGDLRVLLLLSHMFMERTCVCAGK